MPRRLTDEDKKLINEVYYLTKNYAETARRTGFSSTSVKRYVIPNYQPEVKKEKEQMRIPAQPSVNLATICNWGEVCILSAEEKSAMVELRKEFLA